MIEARDRVKWGAMVLDQSFFSVKQSTVVVVMDLWILLDGFGEGNVHFKPH